LQSGAYIPAVLSIHKLESFIGEKGSKEEYERLGEYFRN
jgi:hypothetical protein